MPKALRQEAPSSSRLSLAVVYCERWCELALHKHEGFALLPVHHAVTALGRPEILVGWIRDFSLTRVHEKPRRVLGSCDAAMQFVSVSGSPFRSNPNSRFIACRSGLNDKRLDNEEQKQLRYAGTVIGSLPRIRTRIAARRVHFAPRAREPSSGNRFGIGQRQR